MTTKLSIDRFEGDGKKIAVLLTDGGEQIEFPRALLPAGAKAGAVLSLDVRQDVGATARLKRKARKTRDALKKADPGGDVTL